MAATGLSSSGKSNPWFRALRWTFIGLSALVLAVILYSAYLVVSFDTETLPERYGQADEQLYLGPELDNHPRPLLVLLGGAEGGNAWTGDYWKAQRERFLAQGYALLAIGYFGLPNTPEKLDRIALEGIHAAIQRAGLNPQINGSCIAVIGGSRGGELALLLGSHYPDIRSVVALVPSSAVFVSQTDAMVTAGFALNGKQLPFVPMLWGATPQLLMGDVGGVMRKLIANHSAMQAAAIAVEQIAGPVLLVSATEDEMWPSTEMSETMMSRLQENNFQPVHEHWALPGGHAAPLQAFDRIETFLNTHFAPNRASGGCGP